MQGRKLVHARDEVERHRASAERFVRPATKSERDVEEHERVDLATPDSLHREAKVGRLRFDPEHHLDPGGGKLQHETIARHHRRSDREFLAGTANERARNRATGFQIINAGRPIDKSEVPSVGGDGVANVGVLQHDRRLLAQGLAVFLNRVDKRFRPGTNEIEPTAGTAQFRQTFRNIEKTLAEAGAKLADMVTMTVFLIDAHYTTRRIELRSEL